MEKKLEKQGYKRQVNYVLKWSWRKLKFVKIHKDNSFRMIKGKKIYIFDNENHITEISPNKVKLLRR